MTNFSSLGICELAAGYRSGHFTPVDVIRDVIDRVAVWEPRINALYLYEPEAALAAASRSAARWKEGRAIGVLDGVPVTIKEMIPTQGAPTPMGSAATVLVPAERDGPPAARLREAGAILFAKTTAPDYGMLSSGLSSFHKLTRNPLDLATNPGGSSAGAAAAAACGFGPLHIGTDIGGSIRLPAAWCGLVGFKPSLGRVPIDPYYTGRCAGPMTRTVADAAFAMGVLSLPDARDATSLPPAPIDWHSPLASPKGLRIGLMLQAGCGMALDPQIEAAVSRAAGLFADAGAEIVPVAPVLTREILDGIDLFWRARAWNDIGGLPAERRALVLPFILAWAEGGAQVSGPQAVAGFNCTFELRRRCAELFAGLDAVISPTTPNLSFPAEFASPLNDPVRPFEHIGFTLPWNMSEQPAISLNVGEEKPIGVQIVTGRFADLLALQLAGWLEAACGGHRLLAAFLKSGSR